MGAIMCEKPGEPAQRFHSMARRVFALDEEDTSPSSEEGRAAVVALLTSSKSWPGACSSHTATDLWRSFQHSVFTRVHLTSTGRRSFLAC